MKFESCSGESEDRTWTDEGNFMNTRDARGRGSANAFSIPSGTSPGAR
jgi:hypothetical protein